MPIRKLKARQILDARGDPTVEVDLITEIGLLRSSVPSYIKPNENAGKEIRDGNEALYFGRSVQTVVNTINEVFAPELLRSKLDVNQQREIDLLMQTLDGTPDKSKYGANAMLGVSMAVCKAAAAKRGLPLYKYIAMLSGGTELTTYSIPVPFFDLISGGASFPNNINYRSYFIIPTGATSFEEAMRMGREIQSKLEAKLAEAAETKPPMLVTYKGSYAPEVDDPAEVFGMISEAITEAGHDGKVKLGCDVEANTFYVEGKYDLEFKSEDSDPEDHLEPEDFRATYAELLEENPNIISIEDPFGNDDLESWSALTVENPNVQIVADYMTSMNEEKLEEAVENAAANCLLIKLGQAGTVTEALERVKAARQAGWGVLPSAGPGETDDNFIVDFAIGINAGQIKFGAPSQNPGMTKFNQILRLEEEIGRDGKYAGENFRNPLGEAA